MQRFTAEAALHLKIGELDASDTERHNALVYGVMDRCHTVGISAQANFRVNVAGDDVRRADLLVDGANLYEFKSSDPKGADVVQLRAYVANVGVETDIRLSSVVNMAKNGEVKFHRVSSDA